MRSGLQSRLKSNPYSKVAVVALVILFLCQSVIGGAEVDFSFDPTPKTIIVIMIDSFRPDYVTMFSPPNIQRLVQEGAWVAEGRSIFPSLTSPNQTSFVTGAMPINTGIATNKAYRYDRATDSFPDVLPNSKVLNIAEIMAINGWKTTSVNHFMLENRGAQPYVRGNMEQVIQLVERMRDGLFVYYNAEVDTIAHAHGPFSNETRQAVLAADQEIGDLLSALVRLGLTEQTTLVIASDHGMVTTGGRPMSPTLTEIAVAGGWKIATDQTQITANTDLVAVSAGAYYLYWRNGKQTPEREERLLNELRQIEGATILTADDLRALGTDPYLIGDIAIVPHEDRGLKLENANKGKHGVPQADHLTLLFWGQGIKPGVIVPSAKIIDVVPTLLTLAKLDIPASVEGRALSDIIVRTSWKGRLGKAGDWLVRDVAASDGTLYDTPAMAADGNIYTYWDAAVVGEDTFIAFDFGSPRWIGAVEIVSVSDSMATGPRQIRIEVSKDNVQYKTVYTGSLSAIRNGSSEVLTLPEQAQARYLRLSILSSWASNRVQIAEIKVWREAK
jgi:arylsulfatase A-like enzyme